MNDSSRIQGIVERPTTINQVHESVYRNWMILEYVEWLLAQNTPPAVVLGIVRDLRGLDHKDTTLKELT